ncbi:MAG TPA: ferrous iron transport protein B [Candidatus Polarisedimenticolaceae bacterium]|nr:ferrous iron transport protein B [Candidatus Polarisedimenticolaceae bacterium]
MTEPIPSLPAPVPEGGHAVALVGNPNVGKSVLFGLLTGRYVTVSNYPGTTVEMTSGSSVIAGDKVTVLDTPGTSSLLPLSDDERVTRDVLLSGEAHRVVAVGDAKNLERTVLLALQLCETGVPFVLCLNMMDEAAARGIAIDAALLAGRLGVEVVPTVAVRREGIDRLRLAIPRAAPGLARVTYPEPVERALERAQPLLPPSPLAPRALALMVLCGGEEVLRAACGGQLPPGAPRLLEIARDLQAAYREPLTYVVTQTRVREAWQIVEAVARRTASGAGSHPWRERLTRATTHPLWGLPVLALVLYACYVFVGVWGAGTLVGFLEEVVFGRWINPTATVLVHRAVPTAFLQDMLVGEYGVITMALTYALALILPIVTTFFLAFGVLEDSGYLPRLAVMVHRVFKKMGLNGKAVLPMVLGLGCDTMATVTTRILETPKERMLVILLLALGVPCSAQLTVVLMMLGSLSPLAMLIWLGIVCGVIVLVGAAAARVLPGRGSDFVLELPPLRVPGLRNIAVKTVARLEWYLKEAVPLFVLGTLLLFLADRLHLLGRVERLAAPVVQGVLGLPPETAEAFVIGFLRRDFGAAGLYRMSAAGALSPVQVLVAVVVITLFIPCIANFFMMVKERGWKFGLAAAAFIFPFSLAVGGALHWLLDALHVTLR